MSTIILLRGLPGSGKSTLAKHMVAIGVATHHFEADQWMVDAQGNYEFKPFRLPVVHAKCLNAVSATLEEEPGSIIVVANTFGKAQHISEYLRLALNHHCRFDVYNVRTQFESVHNVPAEAMANMKRYWEDIPDMVLQF